MLVLKLAALCLCVAGYALFASERLKIQMALIPAVLCSALICALFVAGIINFLPLMVWLVVAGGVLLLCREAAALIKSGGLPGALRKFICPATVLLVLSVGAAALYLRGAVLDHIDDFTHWASIVKHMMRENALPGFKSVLITHQSYPPGSALFIWFILQFIGFGEPEMMLAQFILMMSCGCTLFALCGKLEKPLNLLASALLVPGLLFLFSFSVPMFELPVDALLPVMALACTVVAACYRDDMQRGVWVAAPLMVCLLLVKNSGMFYLAVNLALILWLLHKSGLKWLNRSGLLRVGLPLAMPFVAMFVWNRHTDLVYDYAAATFHALRAESIGQVMEFNREPGSYGRIAATFARETLSFSNESLVVMLACNACLLALALLLARKARPAAMAALKLTAAADVVFILYTLSLLGMYLFSMWFHDFEVLASYWRYMTSGTIYCVGVLFAGLLVMLQKAGAKAAKALCASAMTLATAACCLLARVHIYESFNVARYEGSFAQIADNVAKMVGEYGYNYEEYPYSYLVYTGGLPQELQSRSNQFRLQYTLMSLDVDLFYPGADFPAIEEKLPTYSFIIIPQADDFAQAFMEQYGVTGPLEGLYVPADLPLAPQGG